MNEGPDRSGRMPGIRRRTIYEGLRDFVDNAAEVVGDVNEVANRLPRGPDVQTLVTAVRNVVNFNNNQNRIHDILRGGFVADLLFRPGGAFALGNGEL